MFYTQIKGLCDARHIAITALARKLHLSPSAPNNWQSGTLPKAETIMKISEFFDVSTDFLLYGRDRQSSYVSTASNGAAILQHFPGTTVSVTFGGSSDLQAFEAELVRIYKDLDLKGKSALMQYAFTLDENAKKSES